MDSNRREPATVVITGATGLVGTALERSLRRDGVRVVRLVRKRGEVGPDAKFWSPSEGILDPAHLVGADAVVHLAGESIAGHRWSAAQKHRIEESRILATARLVEAIGAAAQPPALLLNGSAVGFYGHGGDSLITEETGAGHDFLASVCRRWEAQAVMASSSQTRVVCLRTGLVLARRGGALPPDRGPGPDPAPASSAREWVFSPRRDSARG